MNSLSCLVISMGSRSSIWLSTWAWMPDCRRTPTASCTTMMASTMLMAVSGEERPFCRMQEMASAETEAEWLLGMPPEPRMRENSKRPLMKE